MMKPMTEMTSDDPQDEARFGDAAIVGQGLVGAIHPDLAEDDGQDGSDDPQADELKNPP